MSGFKTVSPEEAQALHAEGIKLRREMEKRVDRMMGPASPESDAFDRGVAVGFDCGWSVAREAAAKECESRSRAELDFAKELEKVDLHRVADAHVLAAALAAKLATIIRSLKPAGGEEGE